MILVYNFRGILLGILGLVASLGLHLLFQIDFLSVAFGLVVAGGADLYLRYTGRRSRSRALSPNAGGHIWFIPIWVLSIVVAIVALGRYFSR